MAFFRPAPPEGFIARKTAAGRVVHRADLDPGEVDAVLARFLDERHELRALKRDAKASVFAGLGVGGRPLCWKLYREPRRGRRAFRNLVALRRAGVAVAEPFFLWRPAPAGREAIVGMEDLAPRPPLDRWIAARLEAAGDRRDAVRAMAPIFAALGRAVRDLHARGIFLDDLKTCNVFLEGETDPSFRFIDVDGARTGRPVGLARRTKNLSQLNRSTPVGAGVAGRRAFWKEYRRGLQPGSARELRRAAIRQSGERPVVYQTGEGTREEPWPPSARAWPR